MKVQKVHILVHEVHIQVAQHHREHQDSHEKILKEWIAKGKFQNKAYLALYVLRPRWR